MMSSDTSFAGRLHHATPPNHRHRDDSSESIQWGCALGRSRVIGLDGVSAQALSDTIGAIYDCALDPQGWPDTCRKIAELCESTAGGICVHDLRHVQNDQLFVFGYRPEFLETLGSHYAQVRWQPRMSSPISATSAPSPWSATSCSKVGSFEKCWSRSDCETSSGFRHCGPAAAWPPCMPPGARRRRTTKSARSACSSFSLRMSAACSPSPMRSISGR